MNLYNNIADIDPASESVVTIGTFDGVHLGHRKIIESLNKNSAKSGRRSFLVTFDPHPRTVVSDDRKIKVLTTVNEKLAVLKKNGPDNILVVNFTREFSELDYRDFIEKYLIKGMNLKTLVIGHDHKLGRNRAGDEIRLIELAGEFGFSVVKVDSVTENGYKVSSTLIRNLLFEGNVSKASEFLGRNYSLSGVVVKGSQRGRTIGFPTANIEIQDNCKLVPARGVYLCKAKMDQNEEYGIINIGYRPTFNEFDKLYLEVYIFGLSKDIYGEHIEIEFIERLRDEIKFDSVESLIERIKKDIEEAEMLLKTQTNN